MHWLLNLLTIVQVICALGVIILVLLQHGKGADMGAAFGSGSSGSLFGASGSANFLSRTTAVLAVIFFVSTLALAYFGNARPASTGSVLESPAATTVPVAPAPEAGSAAAIPGNAAPAAAQSPAPAMAASGAGQIPAK
jgi:preprotein translocase subunit SecG